MRPRPFGYDLQTNHVKAVDLRRLAVLRARQRRDVNVQAQAVVGVVVVRKLALCERKGKKQAKGVKVSDD